MSMFSPLFGRRFRMVTACLLLVGGGFGVIHSVRAAVAQRLYLKTKYGFFRGLKCEVPNITGGMEVGVRAYRAYDLYPANYYFASYAAKCALSDAQQAKDSGAFKTHRDRALYFSKLAIALNPYDAEGRTVYAFTLAECGRLPEAIQYWRDEVVEREFWNPANHDILARLYLRSPRPSDMRLAVQEIPFVGDNDVRTKLRMREKLLGK